MKTIYFIFILSLISSFAVYADDKYPTIPVTEFPLNDSTVNWDDDGMVIMEDGKGFAALYNNPSGFYFQVLVKDRRLQQQFLRQGLVVYVDPNGKKKKKYAVHFPTLAPPQHKGHPDFNPQDTMGMFGDIRPMHPGERNRRKISKEERERHLKMLVSTITSSPVTFYKGDEESIIAQDSAKITVSGNNIVFSAFVPYDKIGKPGKKEEVSLGISLKKREMSEDGFEGGMMPPPPGMMGGGMMPPPPGMGGFPGRPQMLKDSKIFLEWIIFTIKNTNFTNVKTTLIKQ